MYRKNTGSQFVHFQGVDASTGGIKSGVTWTIRRCIDGTFAAGGGTCTEDGTTGWYKCALSQADTNGNNIGFNFTGTGAVPQTVNIITDGNPPSVDVAKLLGTAWLTPGTAGTPDVNTKLIGGTAPNALVAGRVDAVTSMRSSTAQAGAAGTITLDASASATDNIYIRDLIYLTGGTGAQQCRRCTAYNGTTKVATISPNWTTTPDNTTTFTIIPFTGIDALAVSGTLQTGGDIIGVLGTPAGASLAADLAEIEGETDGIIATLGSPAGASIAADLAEIEGETDAIQASTAGLTFTSAGKVDANMLATNGDATSAANVAKTTRAIGRCTASGVPTTTSIPTSACAPSGAVADQFKGRIITFDADTTTSALRGQATDITASSNSATPTFTVTALTTAPASGDTFSIT